MEMEVTILEPPDRNGCSPQDADTTTSSNNCCASAPGKLCLFGAGLGVIRPVDRGVPQTTILMANRYSSDAASPTRVCIKIIQCTSAPSRQQGLAELAALRLVSFPESCRYVVPLLNSMADDTQLTLVMPFVEGGNLRELSIASQYGLPLHECRRYFTHMVKGLRHLQLFNMAHGDVCLENVVISPASATQPSCAMWVDLGSTCVAGSDGKCAPGQYHYRGGLSYFPPEALELVDTHVCVIDPFACDVWGLGSCLYSMLTGRLLYSSPTTTSFQSWLCENRAHELLSHHVKTFGLALDGQALDLLCWMLRVEPSARPTLHQILLHPWVEFGEKGQVQRHADWC